MFSILIDLFWACAVNANQLNFRCNLAKIQFDSIDSHSKIDKGFSGIWNMHSISHFWKYLSGEIEKNTESKKKFNATEDANGLNFLWSGIIENRKKSFRIYSESICTNKSDSVPRAARKVYSRGGAFYRTNWHSFHT